MLATLRCSEAAFGCLLFVAATVALTGCGVDNSQPPPVLGSSNWKPHGIGGPVVMRPLPQSSLVISDYENWGDSDPLKRARVYETILSGSNQFNFQVRVGGGDTPMGYADTTLVSFTYEHAQKGRYEIIWDRRGRHNLDFLKLGNDSKTVWLKPNGLTNRGGDPQLQLVAFEGLEADWGILAQAGRKTDY